MLHPFQADVCRAATLTSLPSQLDFIFYTAAAEELTDTAYRSVYVDGLRNLLSALEKQRHNPKRILFTSSTAVYAQTRGEWVDEDSATAPSHFSGQRLLEAERLLLSYCFPATVVRLAGIYGPGRTRLIELARRAEASCREPEPRYANRIHRDDCAGVLLHLMRLEKPEPLYLGTDCAPAPRCEVLHWLADRLGITEVKPRPPARKAGRPRSNKRCRNSRLVASGYTFRYPSFREGYSAILEEMSE
jgi:nucleoside-diphosphate-sugar epimerase